jgi:hypothetical protein
VKSSKLNTLKRAFASDFYEALVKGLTATITVPVMQPGELAREAKEATAMKFHTCAADNRTRIAAADGKCKRCRNLAPKWANRQEMIAAIREARDIKATWMDAGEVRSLIIGKNDDAGRKRAGAIQRLAREGAFEELTALLGAGVAASLLGAPKLLFKLVLR